MLGRALSLATVTLLIVFSATEQAHAQVTNLEAGKSPSQIFAGTCNACHKSPRGLLKTVAPGSLPGFLRQHYTTSSDMAAVLSSYLVSNGATDTRYGSAPKQAGAKPDEKPEERSGRKLRQRPDEPEQAAKPDADGEPRSRKRLAKPEETPDEKPAAEAAGERGPDGRKLSAKQRLSKRGKPSGEEPPKEDSKANESPKDSAKSETAKGEDAKPDAGKSDAAKSEQAKPEAIKPETAKADTGAAAPAVRPDPVPAVTPAPTASVSTDSGVSAKPAAPPAEAPAAVAASAPPPVPAGPPEPPISK